MSLFKKSSLNTLLYGLLALSLSSQVKAQSEDAKYTKSTLQQLAVDYVDSQLSPLDSGERELTTLPLDSRIPDRSCNREPEMTIPTTPPFNRQVTVQIKCTDENSWAQYVHVRITELNPVVIATKNLVEGELIKESDLTVVMKPKSFVRAHYLDDPKQLIGSRSKRTIREGMPVRLNQICMVCKGDKVTLVARAGGLTIKTTGTALQDGTLGEQVDVENSRSGKRVSGRVSDVETVAVNI